MISPRAIRPRFKQRSAVESCSRASLLRWIAWGAVAMGLASCSFNGARGRSHDAGIDDGGAVTDASRVDATADAGPVDPLRACTPFIYDDATTVMVNEGDELNLETVLMNAVEGSIIEVAGNHSITNVVSIGVDNVTIRGQANARPLITIADGLNVAALELRGSHISLIHLEFKGGDRQVMVSGPSAGPVGARSIQAFIYDVVFSEPKERGLIVQESDDGVVACSHFSAPAAPCANSRGVEVRDSNNFRAAKNLFSGFDCANNTIGLSVRDSTEPFIERNTFDGFSFAMRIGHSTNGSPGPCEPSGQNWNVRGGVLCNNVMIGQSESRPARGILFQQACAITAVHNTIYGLSNNPKAFQLQKENTRVIAANNLSNGIVELMEGAMVDSNYKTTNQYEASNAAFADPVAGKLTPVVGSTEVGKDLSELTDLEGKCDIDLQGRERSLDSPNFVGAYEAPAL